MGTSNSFGEYISRKTSISDVFGIQFSLSKESKTFVPMGILDYKGKYENPYFYFNYSLVMNNIDTLEFKILKEDDSVLYETNYLPAVVISAKKAKNLNKDIEECLGDKNKRASYFTNTWDWKNIFDKYNLTQSDYTKVGSYLIAWDGFDNEGVFDSSNFNNKKITAVLTAYKNNIKKTIRIQFQTSYSEVDWVDVKIDRDNKRIDTTLRVDLKDGGENGLKCTTYESAFEPAWSSEVCPWDKIPKEILDRYKKDPIKTRTKKFEDLRQLALDGINYHWGRNQNHAVAKDVKVNNEPYEVYVNAINTETNAMDDVDLVFNTNYFWGRSNNPGCVSGFKSFVANLAQFIPYVPLNETIYYNVGYLNNVYKAESHFLFKDDWFYTDNLPLYKNGQSKVDMEYAYTCAHEIGHNILRAYAEKGGGSADYSYKHKGSSGYSDVKPVSEGGFSYPNGIFDEIDLMKYYNNDIVVSGKPIYIYSLDYDFLRIVAEDKDVLSLVWLTKLEIL